jgi:hypothetical protein
VLPRSTILSPKGSAVLRPDEVATPAPTSASASEKFQTWQYEVGAKFAEMAAMVCRGLVAYWDGQSIKEIAHGEGAQLLCECVRLKLHIPEFDGIARKYGAQILNEHLAAPPNPMPDEELIDRVVEATLGLLTGFIKTKLANYSGFRSN